MPKDESEDWRAHEDLSDPPLLFTDPHEIQLDMVVNEFKRIYTTQVIALAESDLEKPAQRADVETLGLVSAAVRQEIARRLNGVPCYPPKKL